MPQWSYSGRERYLAGAATTVAKRLELAQDVEWVDLAGSIPALRTLDAART